MAETISSEIFRYVVNGRCGGGRVSEDVTRNSRPSKLSTYKYELSYNIVDSFGSSSDGGVDYNPYNSCTIHHPG